MSAVEVIILAAGKGTRMRSSLPKVMHPIGGKPMLHHVIETAQRLKPKTVHLVYGHGGEQVKACCGGYPLVWHQQAEQLGTGHAVNQAAPDLADNALTLILYGDVPLTPAQDLAELCERARHGALALLTVNLSNPAGYGRIVRGQTGQVQAIVEHKDASPEQRNIEEVNTGILAVNAARLKAWLTRLDNHNTQGEYYLTDIIAMAVADGINIETHQPQHPLDVEGINTRQQQAAIERYFQRQQASRLMAEGVTLIDPARFDLRGSVKAGRDVVIDVGVILAGNVSLGDGVYIGPNTLVRDCTIADGARIEANCVLEHSTIGARATIGPFARLRPGCDLAAEVHIGNFVEAKKTKIGQGSKAGHLSYLGDAEIGTGVNIGAGTICCNYDGANKHKTVLKDGVFVGSDTQLVAPVCVGKNATIGAGTTVTRDVPEGTLVVSRTPQQVIEGWTRPVKKK